MQVLDRNDFDNILVDKEGYEQFLNILNTLKNKSTSISVDSSQSYKEAVGDGWHDNFDFENLMRESRTVAKMIDKMILDKEKIKVIKNEIKKEELININDLVKIELIYSDNDRELEIIKLTGKYLPDEDLEITLNSPLGNAIYKKKIGAVTNYKVNDKLITVKIIEKVI